MASKVIRRLSHGLLLAGLISAAWASFALAESPPTGALLLQSVNQARIAHGASPLESNAKLDIVALAQAEYLAGLGQLRHLGPNGERLGVRLQAVGYDYAETAENLAAGPSQAARITVLWLESPGHNQNMLHPGYSEAGIGIARAVDGDYWVLILAHPRGK